MRSAFLLGAGLGTRLRPLTDSLPKPLIPVFNKPLVEYHLDHLISLGFERFIINTHHLPECWQKIFGGDRHQAEYRNCPLHFRYEPILLETAGGLKNIEDLSGGEDLLVCNADTLHDLDLRSLIQNHRDQKNAVTLGLRSHGGPLHVQWNPETGLVEDIRQARGGSEALSFLFTGAYVVSPEIFSWIPPRTVISLIPVLLQMIEARRRVGGVLLDGGVWFDLGTPEKYLDAHAALFMANYKLGFPFAEKLQPVARDACVEGAIEGFAAVAAGCHIPSGCKVKNSILWSDASLQPGTTLTRCILRSGVVPPMGAHEEVVF